MHGPRQSNWGIGWTTTSNSLARQREQVPPNVCTPPHAPAIVTGLVIEVPSGTPVLEFRRILRVKLLEYLGVAWADEAFLLETQQVWSRRYGRWVSELEAADILMSLRRLAFVLAGRWGREDR